MFGERGELAARRSDRAVETRLLLGDLRFRERVVLDLELSVRQQMRMADGDAAGNADAVDGKAHHLHRNLRGLRRGLHELGGRAVHGSVYSASPKRSAIN